MLIENELKVCFIGIGSIANRHIRNLRTICAEKRIKVSIDALRRKVSSSCTVQDLGLNSIFYSVDCMPNDYDVIFITNPTELHIDTLKSVQDKGRSFFIEKPIASINTLNEALGYLWKSDVIYYVACPLRYNLVIQYIKDNVKLDDIYSIRCISSSYLPDWRPNTDYRNCYSAHKDMGGGVAIDLIHEWDYITYLFGFPRNVMSYIGKKSDLEIDSDDCAVYIAEYPNMIAEVHLDYFGRKAIREFALYGKDDTIVADLITGTISYKMAEKVIELREDRDALCQRELEHFLDILERKAKNDNTPMRACKVLELTQGII